MNEATGSTEATVTEAPVVEAPVTEAPAVETPAPVEPPKVKTEAEQTEELLSAISEKVQIKDMPPPKEKAPKTQPGTPKEPEEQPKPKQAKALDPKTPDPKAADPKPDPKAEGKKADDFALKTEEAKAFTPNAQQRIREIHGKWKEAEARYETERTQLSEQNQTLSRARDEIMGALTETQTTPEVLGQMLEWNKLVRSGNYDQALAILDHQREALAKMAGKDLPGVDLLADFPDIKAALDGQQVTREAAIHVANLRRQNMASQQADQQRQTALQTQQRDVQVRQQAMQSVEQWEQQKRGADPLYEQKIAALTLQDKDGLSRIDRITRNYPPGLWKLRIEEAYDDLQVAAPAVTTVPEVQVPGLTPLRPSGAKGGNAKPATMEEAVFQKLGIA